MFGISVLAVFRVAGPTDWTTRANEDSERAIGGSGGEVRCSAVAIALLSLA